jgi:hypothetical protein
MNRNTSSRWPDAPRRRAECPDDGGRYLLNAVEQVWTCENPHEDDWKTIRTQDLVLDLGEFAEAGYDGDGACVLWIATPSADDLAEAGLDPTLRDARPEDDDSTDAIRALMEPDPWKQGDAAPSHVCSEHPVPYVSDGPLGHGWECGICGAFLQAG